MTCAQRFTYWRWWGIWKTSANICTMPNGISNVEFTTICPLLPIWCYLHHCTFASKS